MVKHEPVVVSLDVVWQGSSGKNDARMIAVSLSGCFIESNAQGKALGDTVEFKVHLPSGHWLSLQGEVFREDYPTGFELRFTQLTDGDKRLLAQVVAAHGGDPGKWTDPASPSLLDTSSSTIPNTAERAAEIDRAFVDQINASSWNTGHLSSVLGRVLVADDDPLTLRMISAIIKREGYEVVSVGDGREALRILQQDAAFSAAVFDMSMPHLQGLDLIVYMKGDKRLQQIPVGMITAERDPKVWDDSVAAGASVFLPKPFTPPQVAMMIRMLTSKSGRR